MSLSNGKSLLKRQTLKSLKMYLFYQKKMLYTIMWQVLLLLEGSGRKVTYIIPYYRGRDENGKEL